MATSRTLGEIAATASNSPAGRLTNVAIAEMLTLLVSAVGSMRISASAETTIATVNVAIKAAGTTLLNADSQLMDMPAVNRLRYTGANDKLFKIDAHASLTVATDTEDVAIYIALNGTIVAASLMQINSLTGALVKTLSTSLTLLMSTNDYVELWVMNETDDANLTVEGMVMSAIGVTL